MAHWVKAPAIESDALNLISQTPVEGDRHQKIVLFPPHVCIHVHIAHADNYSKNFKLSDFEVVSKLQSIQFPSLDPHFLSHQPPAIWGL